MVVLTRKNSARKYTSKWRSNNVAVDKSRWDVIAKRRKSLFNDHHVLSYWTPKRASAYLFSEDNNVFIRCQGTCLTGEGLVMVFLIFAMIRVKAVVKNATGARAFKLRDRAVVLYFVHARIIHCFPLLRPLEFRFLSNPWNHWFSRDKRNLCHSTRSLLFLSKKSRRFVAVLWAVAIIYSVVVAWLKDINKPTLEQ